MHTDRKVFRITLAATDVDAFLEECSQTAWETMDTGERVMTDEGPDAEVVLLVGRMAPTEEAPPALLLQQ